LQRKLKLSEAGRAAAAIATTACSFGIVSAIIPGTDAAVRENVLLASSLGVYPFFYATIRMDKVIDGLKENIKALKRA